MDFSNLSLFDNIGQSLPIFDQDEFGKMIYPLPLTDLSLAFYDLRNFAKRKSICRLLWQIKESASPTSIWPSLLLVNLTFAVHSLFLIHYSLFLIPSFIIFKVSQTYFFSRWRRSTRLQHLFQELTSYSPYTIILRNSKIR